MSNDITILDLDAMLDVSMDSVENVPDYQNPPPGAYVLKVKDAKTEKKTGKDASKGDYAIIQITYEVLKTVELAPAAAGELPVSDGTMFTERFTISEDGLKYFKKQALKILNVKDAAGATLRDLVGGIVGAEFQAVIAVRTSTKDGKTYENTQIRPHHDTPAA